MKDMTSVATTMMTEEEKAEIEKQLNGGGSPAEGSGGPASVAGGSTSNPKPHTPTVPQSPTTNGSGVDAAHHPAPTSSRPASPRKGASSPPTSPILSTQLGLHDDSATPSILGGANLTPAEKKEQEREAARKRQKIAAENKEKLREHEKERKKIMEKRVQTLAQKMIERLRPFVEAKNPGDKDDPETIAFEEKMKKEADDLKLESFGVEVCSLFRCRSLVIEIGFEAPTYHRECVYDESHVLHEVKEVFGDVSGRLVSAPCRF